MSTGMEATPADLLLRPVPLFAIILLALNDHVLKPIWPGLVTGKLSDIAGMVLCPLLLMAITALILARPWRSNEVAIRLACVAVTVVGFALLKESPTIARNYGDLLGWVRYPLLHHWHRVQIAHDQTDLLALPGAGVAWWDSQRATRRQRVG